MDIKYQFLEGVLGKEGAGALKKASERSESLQGAIIPRAILGFINIYPTHFEGELPGTDNTYCEFTKSEYGYSGVVSIGENNYTFENVSQFHVASAIAVAIGAQDDVPDVELRDVDLVKLGKSIDLLAKARYVTNELNKKLLDPNAGYQFSHEHHDLGGGNMLTKINVHSPTGDHVGAATFMHQGPHIVPGTVAVDEDHQRRGIASAMYRNAEKITGKMIKPSPNQTPEGAALWQGNKTQPQFGIQKAEAPGAPVKPFQATTATQPQMQPKQRKGAIKLPSVKTLGQPPKPDMQLPQPVGSPAHGSPILTNSISGKPPAQPKLPSAPKLPSVKVTKSESAVHCPVCDRAQFKDGAFIGCFCLRDLKKHTKVETFKDYYVLTFDRNWDEDAISVLLESLGRK